MVLFYHSCGECAVYYVKDSGNDNASGLTDTHAWKSIKKVNNSRLKDGDTVCFKRGSVFTDATLNSPNADNITFTDYGEGEKPRIDGNRIRPINMAPVNKIRGLTIRNIDISGQNWLQSKSSNLYVTNVEGVIIDGVIGDGHKGGNTSKGKSAITVERCTGKIVISNCQLKNWGPTNLRTMGQDFIGIVVLNITDGGYEISKNSISNITADAIHLCDNTAPGLVKQNTASNCGENGVDIKGTSNCLILENEFYRTSDFLGEGGSGSGGYPVHVVVHKGYVNAVASNNTIRSNLFHDGDAAGVVIADAHNTRIIDNDFVSIASSIYIANNSNMTLVENNVIVNPMYRSGYKDMESGCIFENNAGTGTRIQNNTIYNSTGTAKHLISLACAHKTEISKNVVYQQKADEGALLLYHRPCGTPPIINNNCWYNKLNTNHVKYQNVIYSLQNEQKWSVRHAGDVFRDPLFRDPAQLDFQLDASSPCQSGGVMWGAFPKGQVLPLPLSIAQTESNRSESKPADARQYNACQEQSKSPHYVPAPAP